MVQADLGQPEPLPKAERGGASDTPNLQGIVTEISGRRFIFGIVASIIGFVVLGSVFWVGFRSLGEIEKYKPANTMELHAMIVATLAHAVYVVALAYLAYALLRAAERMFIPRYLLSASDDPGDIIRAILGLDTPVKAALKEVKDIVGMLSPLAPKDSKHP